MAKLRLGTSYWLDRYTGRAPRFGTMRGRHQADIAVVGGGVTGCLAACLFARAGARVVLVEARRIGRGSTAASTALLMQVPYIGAHRRYPRQLVALGYGGNGMTFGYLAAELLVRAARGAPAPDDDLFGFGRTATAWERASRRPRRQRAR
jgi:glycine/D-amino acid oxidase-like deaminating enzyme